MARTLNQTDATGHSWHAPETGPASLTNRHASAMRIRKSGGGRSRTVVLGESAVPSTVVPAHGLVQQGLATPAALHWNLLTGPLVELAVQRGEGLL